MVCADGERLSILADDGAEEGDGAMLAQQVSQEVRTMVFRNELRAVAFAQNIEYQSAVDRAQVDAIEVDLDHINDNPVTCILPYTIGPDGQPMPGGLFAIDPRETFFSTCD